MYKYIFILIVFFNSLSAQIPDGYYDDADGLNGEELKTILHEIIDDHIEFPYTSGSTDVWDILKDTDRDPDDPENVILFYTGWSVNGAQEYNNGNGWSREHVWAKSHGDFGTSPGPGTDVHHLRPSDISVNSARGNKDFDNGGTEYIDGDGATGCYSDADSWEARDAVKGDVARMIFYMAVRYEGDSGELDLEMVDYVNSAPDPVHGKFSTLMEWNLFDPVDDFERNRNDIIFEDYQENRNPFIDHPEYALMIWGDEIFDAVQLAVFTISFDDALPLLAWTTNMENDNIGWNIYRSETPVIEQSIQINDEVIPGQGTSVETTDYSYWDEQSVVTGQTYWYWLENFNTDGDSWLHGPVSLTITGVNDTPVFPVSVALHQNYPNPFNPSTVISFQLSEDSSNEDAELSIYNIKGQKIKQYSLFNDQSSVVWNGRDDDNRALSSGVYYYRLTAGAAIFTKRMILLK